VARQQLIGNIQALDGLLTAQQHQLRLNGQRRMARLRRVSPLWLVGGGLVTGLVAGRLASSRTLADIGLLGRAGLYSWVLGGIRLWRLSGSLLPQPFGPAMERDA